MTVETASELLLQYAPRIGERLAQVAMEWAVLAVSDHGGTISAESLSDLPEVKMFDPQEIVAHAMTDNPAFAGTLIVGFVTDDTATEYLRIDPATGDLTTEQS